MVKKIVILSFFWIVFFTLSSNSIAYDNVFTHKDITKRSIKESIDELTLDSYLKQYLEFPNGFDSVANGKPIFEWLQDGSKNEDEPKCRASSHFHNPLLPWDESKMTDDVGPVTYLIGRLYCGQEGWTYENRKSNVTWATGYLSPSPDGSKDSFSSDPEYAPINWDKAREYYYNALISRTESDRESNFANAFEALGHVLHLLQDVSVPAHVRNDFTSHLTFTGIETTDPANWFNNPFEYYVMTHPYVVTRSVADLPAFTDVRLTDFWDTDQYTGETPPSTPEAVQSLGLAESTNAI